MKTQATGRSVAAKTTFTLSNREWAIADVRLRKVHYGKKWLLFKAARSKGKRKGRKRARS